MHEDTARHRKGAPPGGADAPPPLGLLEYLDLTENRPVRDKRDTAFAAALLAERLGYSRLWLPEHHARGVPSTNPLLLAAVLGSHTRRVRVGTAVTLSRVRDPHLTAEDVAAAAHFCPDRLDVGFGRGDVSGAAATDLAHLRERGEDVGAAIDTTLALLRGGAEWIDPVDTGFQLWSHGAGTRSAGIAAKAGVNYCHALFFNTDVDACVRTLDAYRAAHPAGRTAVALALVANDDAATARADSLRHGVRVNCAGTADQCAEAVHRVLALTGADEAVVTELSSDPDDHLRAVSEVFAAVRRGAAQPSGAAPAPAASAGSGAR
ncbi:MULTISPECIES: LLM class flavin-dependent oxidoreductase [unclassified Nocardiopsis]|uniref:LLM class flavin-dependent oxidoreductase n=1 Tax=unclassified Nocardiopsis TaxID=2649073 RepID=UPI00135C0748|nr:MULTISPECIES: LLM class flavin-dependent oxidoreductase [unclassified Nocardiopsis]